MTREEAKKWLESLRIKDFGWDDYAMQESQTEIRERCENAIREAIDMAIEALSQPIVAKHFDVQSGYIYCSPQDAENVKAVVRCKDCRWFKQDSSPVGYGYCDGRMVGREVDYNDFCSYGERQCNYFGKRREP